MQISQIRNYNISTKQNLKKNNVAFQQAPIDKTLKTVMNNPNSKKVFIKLDLLINTLPQENQIVCGIQRV